ncbi:hypothetical protein ACFTAO_24185 [Paenibacillus rhizoplanae]
MTLPAGKSAEVTLHGGASAGLDKGMSLNIHEGTEFVFDDDTPLGFLVVSGNPFRDVNMDDWFYSYVNSAYTYGLFQRHDVHDVLTGHLNDACDVRAGTGQS